MGRRKTEAEVRPAWFMPDELVRVPVDELVPYARNARTHSEAQIAQLRASLREFGFVSPVLIDGERNIIAGHGRVLAAQAEGMTEVPCVLVEHLTDTQRRAYILADNRLAEMSGWDMELVSLELGDLQAADFDLTLTGFDEMDLELEPPEDDAPAKKTASAENDDFAGEEAEKAIPGQEPDDEERLRQAFEAGMQAAEYGEADEAYDAFVEKFKPKKTTDDCYTPELVYEAVRDWAVRKYGLEGRPLVRPFYPGGDYQRMTYPDGAVVLDNPPFSILSQIVEFYETHHIDYFLFAPALTLFSSMGERKTRAVIAAASVIYANGAQVNTSFLTSLGEAAVTVAPDLHEQVEQASQKNREDVMAPRHVPSYSYPAQVATAALLGKLAKYGQALEILPGSCTFVRQLDSQKEAQKTIFGGGLLLSEKAAAEKAAAEKAAAEKAAAEKAAAHVWQLSEREQAIIQGLK